MSCVVMYNRNVPWLGTKLYKFQHGSDPGLFNAYIAILMGLNIGFASKLAQWLEG